MRIALALVLAVGCTDDPHAPAPVPDMPMPDPVLPTPELVATANTPIDLDLDETHVYWLDAWTELSPEGTTYRGHVVRWSKATGDVTVLAAIEDAVPADIAVAGDHIYWTELRGFTDNGRLLGHDHLVRVAKTGGTRQIVATEQYFDSSTPRGNVFAHGDHIYWASEGAAPNGAIRRVRDADPLATVETLGTELDRPRALATDGAHLCFRTGHPNQASNITCAPVSGGPLFV